MGISGLCQRPLSSLMATPVTISSFAAPHGMNAETLGRISLPGSQRSPGTLKQFLHGGEVRQHLRLQILRVWHLAQGLFALVFSDGDSYCWALSIDTANLLEVAAGHTWNHVMLVDVILYKCRAHDGQPCVFVLSLEDTAQYLCPEDAAQIQDTCDHVRLGAGSWRVFGRPVLQVCSLTQTPLTGGGASTTVFAAPCVIQRHANKNIVDFRVRLHAFSVSRQGRLLKMELTDGATYLSAVCNRSSVLHGQRAGRNSGLNWTPGDVLQVRLAAASADEHDHAPARILEVQRVVEAIDAAEMQPACGPYHTFAPLGLNDDMVVLRTIMESLCTTALSMCMLVNTQFLVCVLTASNNAWTRQHAWAVMSDRLDVRQWPVSVAARIDLRFRRLRMATLLQRAMPAVHQRMKDLDVMNSMRSAVCLRQAMTDVSMQPSHFQPRPHEHGMVPYEALAFRLRAHFDSTHAVTLGRGMRGVSWHSQTDATSGEMQVFQEPSSDDRKASDGFSDSGLAENRAVYGVLRTIISSPPSSPHDLHCRQVRLHNPGIPADNVATKVNAKDSVFRRWQYAFYLADSDLFSVKHLFRDPDACMELRGTQCAAPLHSTEMFVASELAKWILDDNIVNVEKSNADLEASARQAQLDRPLTRGVVFYLWCLTYNTCDDALDFLEQEVETAGVSIVTGVEALPRPMEEWFNLSPYCYKQVVAHEQSSGIPRIRSEYVRLNLQCCGEPVLYGKKVFYSVSTLDDSEINTCVIADSAYVSFMLHDGEHRLWVSSRCPSMAQIMQEVLVAAQQDAHYTLQADDPLHAQHYPSRSCLDNASTSILENMILALSWRDPCLKSMLPPTHLFSTQEHEDDGHNGRFVSYMFEVFDCVLVDKNCQARLGADNINCFGGGLEKWLGLMRDRGEIDATCNHMDLFNESETDTENTFVYSPGPYPASSLPHSASSTLVYTPASSVEL